MSHVTVWLNVVGGLTLATAWTAALLRVGGDSGIPMLWAVGGCGLIVAGGFVRRPVGHG